PAPASSSSGRARRWPSVPCRAPPRGASGRCARTRARGSWPSLARRLRGVLDRFRRVAVRSREPVDDAARLVRVDVLEVAAVDLEAGAAAAAAEALDLLQAELAVGGHAARLAAELLRQRPRHAL